MCKHRSGTRWTNNLPEENAGTKQTPLLLRKTGFRRRSRTWILASGQRRSGEAPAGAATRFGGLGGGGRSSWRRKRTRIGEIGAYAATLFGGGGRCC
jgi:hypothetical protein